MKRSRSSIASRSVPISTSLAGVDGSGGHRALADAILVRQQPRQMAVANHALSPGNIRPIAKTLACAAKLTSGASGQRAPRKLLVSIEGASIRPPPWPCCATSAASGAKTLGLGNRNALDALIATALGGGRCDGAAPVGGPRDRMPSAVTSLRSAAQSWRASSQRRAIYRRAPRPDLPGTNLHSPEYRQFLNAEQALQASIFCTPPSRARSRHRSGRARRRLSPAALRARKRLADLYFDATSPAIAPPPRRHYQTFLRFPPLPPRRPRGPTGGRQRCQVTVRCKTAGQPAYS